uniref:Uncharacterized protein n=1 Tax=Ditylenchus dipsaci TaxID=166011 RepID=A0A915DC31_9BILA
MLTTLISEFQKLKAYPHPKDKKAQTDPTLYQRKDNSEEPDQKDAKISSDKAQKVLDFQQSLLDFSDAVRDSDLTDPTQTAVTIGEFLAGKALGKEDLQTKAQTYFLKGVDSLYTKIEKKRTDEQQKADNIKNPENLREKATKNLAIVLQAILHFSKWAEKPIIVLALIGAMGGCIAGVILA